MDLFKPAFLSIKASVAEVGTPAVQLLAVLQLPPRRSGSGGLGLNRGCETEIIING